jgi:thiamine-phosphate pyrophosphorylase
MKRYYITDRKQLGGIDELLACVARNDRAQVDMIQIREKDLTARELLALTTRVMTLCSHSRVLVNSRLDIALAASAHGVHLPADSPPPSAFRPLMPPGFLAGVSCHSLEEVIRAEREGADFVVLGPIFKPLSKDDPRVPLGVAELSKAAQAVRLPVYALGGLDDSNLEQCLSAGAAGVAGITLFQRSRG